MTNLIATVLVTVTTNLQTLYVEDIKCNVEGCVGAHHGMKVQAEVYTTNKILHFHYENIQRDVVIESVQSRPNMNSLKKSVVPTTTYTIPIWTDPMPHFDKPFDWRKVTNYTWSN